MKPTLLVLAAGIGSRYGGLKQMDPIGPSGEFILDYSVFDAIRAGFGRIVFVIRRDIEDAFRRTIGERVARHIDVDYVCQALTDVPAGVTVPASRTKPWGTGQAVLVCHETIREPFGVINADDFYGRDAFRVLGTFLSETADAADQYGMVAFTLSHTLSEHGSVSRGICASTPEGYLASVEECTHIENHDGHPYSTERELDGSECASMNMWAFKPGLFAHLETAFSAFLNAHGAEEKSEFFIPTVINDLMTCGQVSTRVLTTDAHWFGVTNPEDRERVVARVQVLVDAGEYPASLW